MSPHPHQHLLSSDSDPGLICFPDATDVELLFLCLWPYAYLIWSNVCSDATPYFDLGCLSLYYCILVSFYTFWIQVPCQMYDLSIFSLVLWVVVFHSLFFFLNLAAPHCLRDLSSLTGWGLNPGPGSGKHQLLTTRPPGNILCFHFLAGVL